MVPTATSAAALLLPLALAKSSGLAPSPSAPSASSASSSAASTPTAAVTSASAVPDELDRRASPSASTERRAGGNKRADGEEKASKPKKARKRTYYVRKEEMARLKEELRELEDANARLMDHAAAARTRAAAHAVERQNAALNDAIRGQRLLFANAHSMFTQFMRVQEQSPFETFIRLGRDALTRHATLQAMKRQKLRAALEFLDARVRHLDVTSDFCERQTFSNQQGDQCYMSFDVTPLPRASTSVKAVFDVLLNFAYTFEMSLSEVLGDITIRENDDSWDPSVSQHRLVTLVGNQVQMETNQVMFTEYFPLGPTFPGDTDCLPLSPPSPSSRLPSSRPVGQELGILATDFVNDDELFPYRTSERLRQDVTVLTMVRRGRSAAPATRELADSAVSADSADSADTVDDLVVLVRWALIRVRASAIPLSNDLRRVLHDGMRKVDEAMITSVRASIGPRPSTFSILHPMPHRSASGEAGPSTGGSATTTTTAAFH